MNWTPRPHTAERNILTPGYRRGTFVMLCGMLAGAFLISGCGQSATRKSQNWRDVSDPRFFRVCQVTNHGSGVVIARTGDTVWVLTCAHVVEHLPFVNVYVPREDRGGYVRQSAKIAARSHTTKVDLALLSFSVKTPRPEFRLRLAPPLAAHELRQNIDILCVTEPDQPKSFTGQLLEQAVLWGGAPDELGKSTYLVSCACLYGGIQGANSGSPIFEGDRLIGLHHFSPFVASPQADKEGRNPEGADLVEGIGVSTPQRLREFLVNAGYAHLLEE